MSFFEKEELSILWPFYLESILGYIVNFAPAFMLVYFLEIGLSLLQVGFLTSAALTTALVFEIPTGAIADLYGRKFSVLLGYALEGILFIAIAFSTNFYYLLGIFIIFGIAGTLSSGAKEAWVIDLIRSKRKKFSQNYFMKSGSIVAFSMFFSGILGAFLVKSYGVRIIWYFAGAGFLLSVFMLALFAQESFKQKKTKVKESFKEVSKQTKTSISFSLKHPILFWYLLAMFFIAFQGVFSTSISWVPFLQELNLPVHYFGYMWSGMMLVAAVSPLFSKKLMTKGKEINFFIKMSIIGGGSFLLVYFVHSWVYAIAIMLFAEFFWETQTPVSKTYFHKFIPSKLRATVGSFQGMIYSFAGIIGMPIAGYLVDTVGARYVIMISGILTIPAIISYLMIKEEGME
jgi:MFS family permease